MLDTAAYLLFVGAGLYGTRQGFRELKQAHLSRSWPHTTGVILTSKSLVESLGDPYRAYRRRVPKLIPFTKFAPKRDKVLH